MMYTIGVQTCEKAIWINSVPQLEGVPAAPAPNPSIVAAVVDYCLIALAGKGKVIIGDAPTVLRLKEVALLRLAATVSGLIALFR